jgi:hypothetical protein
MNNYEIGVYTYSSVDPLIIKRVRADKSFLSDGLLIFELGTTRVAAIPVRNLAYVVTV